MPDSDAEWLRELAKYTETGTSYTVRLSESAARLRAIAQRLEPIPVGERLPDWAIPVLAWIDTSAIPDTDPYGYWTHACISRDGHFYEFGGLELEGPVTHWMQMPPAPE